MHYKQIIDRMLGAVKDGSIERNIITVIFYVVLFCYLPPQS